MEIFTNNKDTRKEKESDFNHETEALIQKNLLLLQRNQEQKEEIQFLRSLNSILVDLIGSVKSEGTDTQSLMLFNLSVDRKSVDFKKKRKSSILSSKEASK